MNSNIIKRSHFDIIHTITNTSIFKIIKFLDIIFKSYEKIIIIDVGCALGDFSFFLQHLNKFSIGIDPLINYYRKQKNSKLSNYNSLYDVAIDINTEDKLFNITKSKDTSSLYNFNNKNLTTDKCIIDKFYIPIDYLHHITDIIEQRNVKCMTLQLLIEISNLKDDIIHILKVDAQGNDLNVIKSGEIYLKNIMFIVMESNSDTTSTLYENTTKFTEDYEYLKLHNFELITKEILLRDDYDCLYYNKGLISE